MAEGIEEAADDTAGNVATINLLDGVTLTDDFDDNESGVYSVAPFSQLELILDYTMDTSESGNAAVLQLLLSENGEDFHEYAIASDGSPASNVVLSTLYARRLGITGTANVLESRWFAIPTSAKFFKVKAMESGLSSVGGILTAKARVSNGKACY